jgi:hypothetical protein
MWPAAARRCQAPASRKIAERNSIGPISSITTSRHACSALAHCWDGDSLERRKIEPIFSEAFGRFEINMGQHGLVAFERHQRESDADAAVADFLGLKTSGAFWQIFATRLISVVLPQPGRPVSKFSVSSQAR